MANPLITNQGQQTNLNPQLTQMLQQPGAQQLLQQLQQQMPGKSPREMAYQMAQNKGIPLNQIEQLFSQLTNTNRR